MRRLLLYIVLFFFSTIHLFSQNNLPSDKLKRISLSDTVFFKVEPNGCDNLVIMEYKFVKLKTNEHVITVTGNTKETSKTLTAKNYEVFIYRFRQSAQRFKYADEGDKQCACKVQFKLSARNDESAFINNTCEAEFNPEELLKQLMK